jgi:hypothetical protein
MTTYLLIGMAVVAWFLAHGKFVAGFKLGLSLYPPQIEDRRKWERLCLICFVIGGVLLWPLILVASIGALRRKRARE